MKFKTRTKALDETINRYHYRCTTIVLYHTMPCTHIYIYYYIHCHRLDTNYICISGSIEDVFVISDLHNAFPAYTVHLIKTLSEEYPVTWRYQHKIAGTPLECRRATDSARGGVVDSMTKATTSQQYRRGLIGSTVTGSRNPLRKSPCFTVYTAAVRVERETLINLITALERHIIILISTVEPLVILLPTRCAKTTKVPLRPTIRFISAPVFIVQQL